MADKSRKLREARQRDETSSNELLSRCTQALNGLTVHCRHKEPGYAALPQQLWDQVLTLARKVSFLRQTVRDLEWRELNPHDAVEVVRRISRVQHEVIVARGVYSPERPGLARVDLEAFSQSSENMISCLRALIRSRQHETLDDDHVEFVAESLNVLFKNHNQSTHFWFTYVFSNDDDQALKDEMESVLHGNATVTVGQWQHTSAISLIGKIAHALEEDICTELECAEGSFPDYGILGLNDGLPMDLSDNMPSSRACDRKIRKRWRAVRKVLCERIPEDDDVVYLRQRAAEEHQLLRMKQAEHLRRGDSHSDSSDGCWQCGYLGTNLHHGRYTVRRAGYEPTVDLSSHLLQWEILKILVANGETLTSRDALLPAWEKYGKDNQPTPGTVDAAVCVLRQPRYTDCKETRTETD
ncbi:MAG: hypothetical protein ACYC4U_12855 [Pirellulaceae bacterium]